MDRNENTVAETAKKKIRGAGILIHKAVLLIVSENFFGKAFVPDKHETVIGRDRDCDICLNDNHLSGKHCRIVATGEGHHFLEDMDSTNGTFLNKKKVKKRSQLYYQDRIVAGNTIIRFFLEEKIEK